MMQSNPMRIFFRVATLLGCVAMLGLSVPGLPSAHAKGGSHDGHNHGQPPKIKDVSATDIAKPGELAEVILGRDDAPVTIIEYASITCGHCGRFHRDLLPKLKAKYIDTGIAKFFVREFPLENIAAAASLLARCAGHDKTYSVIEALFERQQQWLRGNDVRDALVALTSEFGMDEAAFSACLDDKALFKKIAAVRRRANKDFGVRSTPTFFINGKALVGPTSLSEFDAIIEPMMKK
jgi:protein-disulfide isomerase